MINREPNSKSAVCHSLAPTKLILTSLHSPTSPGANYPQCDLELKCQCPSRPHLPSNSTAGLRKPEISPANLTDFLVSRSWLESSFDPQNPMLSVQMTEVCYHSFFLLLIATNKPKYLMGPVGTLLLPFFPSHARLCLCLSHGTQAKSQ